ncbi:MAG: protein kinase, partial [Myxococcota bacterium]|nr:protein kinase [Myxococcota bacterium]
VVRLVEHGEIDGRIYVITGFVPGGTLHELLEDYADGLPPVVVAHWGLQLVETLGSLHDAGIVHRDVKPANLLLSWAPDSAALDRLDDDPTAPLDGVPDLLLADFGAVLLYREERFSRYEGPGAATPYTRGYAPVEQVLRLPEQGPHTDLFALGVLLTEMLTGSRRREQATRLLDGGGDEEPAAEALDALERIPPRLAEVLADCVEPRPEVRLSDIRKFEIALRAEFVALRGGDEVVR